MNSVPDGQALQRASLEVKTQAKPLDRKASHVELPLVCYFKIYNIFVLLSTRIFSLIAICSKNKQSIGQKGRLSVHYSFQEQSEASIIQKYTHIHMYNIVLQHFIL